MKKQNVPNEEFFDDTDLEYLDFDEEAPLPDMEKHLTLKYRHNFDNPTEEYAYMRKKDFIEIIKNLEFCIKINIAPNKDAAFKKRDLKKEWANLFVDVATLSKGYNVDIEDPSQKEDVVYFINKLAAERKLGELVDFSVLEYKLVGAPCPRQDLFLVLKSTPDSPQQTETTSPAAKTFKEQEKNI